jgi:3',5'-nucleoside bisphosphate phosphatase
VGNGLARRRFLIALLMKSFRADLHVHTLLSPCAGVEMIPPRIVQEALDLGIQLIAITDHNATANIEAVMKAAEGSEVIVLPGVELQTREDVHTLCLFDTLEQAHAFQAWIDALLPPTPNNPDFFGEQFVVDYTGDFIRREERLLINSVDASLSLAYEVVHSLGGLFIPAHINRQAFGLITILGLVPTDFQVEALEISRHITPQAARQKYRQIAPYPLIQNGDVHFLDGFYGSSTFLVEQPTIAEIRKAIRSEEGRELSIVDNPLS